MIKVSKMASRRFICLVFSIWTALLMVYSAAQDDKKEYIVYMGALPAKADYSPMSHHQSILEEVIESNSVGDCLVRCFGRSFNGFVAKLTEAESKKLAAMEGIVSVFPSVNYQIQTTRSYDFIGLNDTIKRIPQVETDMVVGVIDTGIWPEHRSFSDVGYRAVPTKWKGACNGGTNFTCNKKLIGARHYVQGTVRDTAGHGTHTASTAAGNKVEGASFFGIAEGTARGGVPGARIAAYRVCDPEGCNNAGIMAAFDDAIADGVDLITVSLVAVASPFDQEPIAIGSFHAMERGIITVAAGGNDGTGLRRVRNNAPWVLTVAASTSDRKLATNVVTGDGKTLIGTSMNEFDLKGKKYPLLYGKTSSDCTEEMAWRCESGCYNDVKGKILVCDNFIDVEEPKKLGAVGAILRIGTDSYERSSLPVSFFDYSEYTALLAYINSTQNPSGTILQTERIPDVDAPVVAPFSSRGPSSIVSDILKPDISAPGVRILAAYPPVAPLKSALNDGRVAEFAFLSGTSMAAPHAAGAAAYLKTIHPDWTVSAVKSALMTTARKMDPAKSIGKEFAYGAGHIDPVKAADPGLVYETTREEYLTMLCGLNYTSVSLKIISGDNVNCSQGSSVMVRDMNYPSMTAKVSASSPSEITFTRTVTNVGNPQSNYKVETTAEPRLSVKVEPQTLSFTSLGEKKSFKVTVSAPSGGFGSISGLAAASLFWNDGSHSVKSPIVIYS